MLNLDYKTTSGKKSVGKRRGKLGREGRKGMKEKVHKSSYVCAYVYKWNNEGEVCIQIGE